METRTACITGGSGADARTLAKFLLKKGYRVIFTFRHLLGSYEKLRIKHEFEEFCEPNETNCKVLIEKCNQSDPLSISMLFAKLSEREKIDEFYLLAGESHVGDSFIYRETAITTNGLSTLYFLEKIKEFYPNSKTFYAASSEMTGGTTEKGFDENFNWKPQSFYAAGKELGCRLIDLFKAEGLFCCYGVLTNHSNELRPERFFIRKVTKTAAEICLGQKERLKLGDINWSRDEYWADFGCEAMWKMLQLENPENFAIGNGIPRHAEEYLDHAFSYFNLNWREHVDFDQSLIRPNCAKLIVADPRKAIDKLGWNPKRMDFKTHVEKLCSVDYANLRLTS